jgi:outer membrane lipoprotein-sorting protein
VLFDPNDGALRSTEMEFRDGSVFRNEFRNAEVNPAVPPDLLSDALPPGTKIVTPAASGR